MTTGVETPRRFVQVPLSEDQYSRLRERAKRNERSMAGEIRAALKFQKWFAELVNEGGYVLQKYNPDGSLQFRVPLEILYPDLLEKPQKE